MTLGGMAAFTSVADASSALVQRLAAAGISPEAVGPLPDQILDVVTAVSSPDELPGAKAEAFSLIKTYAPLDPPMLRVILVAWVNELVGSTGMSAGGTSFMNAGDSYVFQGALADELAARTGGEVAGGSESVIVQSVRNLSGSKVPWGKIGLGVAGVGVLWYLFGRKR